MTASIKCSGALITGAKFYFYTGGVRQGNTNSTKDIALVQTTQASISRLDTNDYSQIGTTEGGARILLSSLSSGYNYQTLNATGLGWINKTSWTKLGQRVAWDIDDIEPLPTTWNGSGVNIYQSDYTGTDHDPYLEVEHYNTNFISPTNLKTEGQTNPNKVTDSYPEFYATYNGANPGMYYLIQVTASPDWKGLVWSSGKTSMATTESGYRSPSISYEGRKSLAFDGATYYWRIRFWGDGSGGGGWSDGIANFTMANSARIEFP